jgi:hypothetical protein
MVVRSITFEPLRAILATATEIAFWTLAVMLGFLFRPRTTATARWRRRTSATSSAAT